MAWSSPPRRGTTSPSSCWIATSPPAPKSNRSAMLSLSSLGWGRWSLLLLGVLILATYLGVLWLGGVQGALEWLQAQSGAGDTFQRPGAVRGEGFFVLLAFMLLAPFAALDSHDAGGRRVRRPGVPGGRGVDSVGAVDGGPRRQRLPQRAPVGQGGA